MIYSATEQIAPPNVISACRTREEQRALQRAWDRGEREGLLVRPADPENSLHVPDEDGMCFAFDLGNGPEWLEQVGKWAARIPGVTWGGTWLNRDRGHFQVKADRLVLVASIRLV